MEKKKPFSHISTNLADFKGNFKYEILNWVTGFQMLIYIVPNMNSQVWKQ